MEVIHNIQRMQAVALRNRQQGRNVALVPTMGYLHDGHLSLVRQARQMAEIVVVSIFVNPTQFGPSEDFESYPRDLIRDCDLLQHSQVDIVFAPEADEMYGKDFSTRIEMTGITDMLCGTSRPGHFSGVMTVVTKLFNIVLPDFALFGQKDYQQSVVIRRMVRDLNMPVEISVCSTVRESDGLALSSRNTYLSEEERKVAPLIYQALQKAEEWVRDGERSAEKIRKKILALYGEEPSLNVEYVEVVDPDTLQPVKKISRPAVIAVAVRLGETRLIDNTMVDVGGER